MRFLLISARRDLLFLCGAFKIVLQKGLTVDFEKSPGLGLFGKSGAGKQQRLLLSGSILGAGGSQVYLVDGKNELQALLTSYNVPLESLTSFLCSAVSSSNGATRRLPQRRSTSGTFRLRLARWDYSG